ncbi:S8 family serine peptidase [Tropicibacter sp. R16_0]|uniref:S8 family serine peptidase n=1 Tax=Tropicibacter sp. R16_0 TaxID=2821102 RepID=UPI001ADA2C89|nr:S8 family serine peptidase [Tropicibacter sp. R16_0]MBO9451054.1 S8 family serine peptidase [Tropicibacter sp. R16_0]
MTKTTVRLVPRSSQRVTFSDYVSMPQERLSGSVAPERRSMNKAIKAFDDRAIPQEASPLKRLDVQLDEQEMADMFGDVAMEQHPTRASDDRSVSLNETFNRPAAALNVPEALQDSIAFAYVPRPVEFFAPLPFPPIENIYHLRLSDVRLALNAARCHMNGWTGKGVRVAMADTGFMLHPYYVRSGLKLIPTASPGSGPADIDHSGHGTGEAGNIFAVAPDCTVFGVKHGSSAAGTLETCIDQNPDVMTNSWGYNIDRMTKDELRINDPNMFFEVMDVEAVINDAIQRNIAVLFSAGNGHRAFPASHPDVISVGGVTLNEDGSIEASNYASSFRSLLYPGQNIPDFCGLVGRSEMSPQSAHIMLPVPPDSELDGENFPSGLSQSGWGIFSGTSAACPQTAGLVALLKQISKGLSPAQIRQVLNARSVDVTEGTTATGDTAAPGHDLATGAGLVDALRACGFAVGTS